MSRLAYTVEELAEELRYSPDTIRRLIREGRLIAFSPGGERGLRIAYEAVVAMLLSAPAVATEHSNPTGPKQGLQGLSGAKPRRKRSD